MRARARCPGLVSGRARRQCGDCERASARHCRSGGMLAFRGVSVRSTDAPRRSQHCHLWLGDPSPQRCARRCASDCRRHGGGLLPTRAILPAKTRRRRAQQRALGWCGGGASAVESRIAASTSCLQEAVGRLSTSGVAQRKLEPRPFICGVFLARLAQLRRECRAASCASRPRLLSMPSALRVARSRRTLDSFQGPVGRDHPAPSPARIHIARLPARCRPRGRQPCSGSVATGRHRGAAAAGGGSAARISEIELFRSIDSLAHHLVLQSWDSVPDDLPTIAAGGDRARRVAALLQHPFGGPALASRRPVCVRDPPTAGRPDTWRT